MTYLDLLKRRYATKKFDGTRITDSQLKQLKEAIRLSPSSFNIQSWKVLVISDAATKEKLKPLSWDQEQITTCSHLFVFCVPTDAKKHLDSLLAAMRKAGTEERRVAGFGKMVGGSIESRTPAQLLSWMQRQAFLPLMSLMSEAADLGLDSCPMEGFDSEAYAKALDLKGLVPTVLCPVGHAADTPQPKFRFEEKDIFV